MIARKSALILSIETINGVLGYLALFLVARYMSMPDYALGIISFAYGLVSIYHLFASLGFLQAHVKFISEGQDFQTCMGTFVVIKVSLTGLMILLLISSLFIWQHVLGRGFESPEHESAIYVMLVYFILWSLSLIMRETFQAKKETAKQELPMLFETLGRVSATIYVIWRGLGPLALAWTYVVGEILVFVSLAYFFRGNAIGKPSWELFKKYALFAWPLAIVAASTIIMTNIDKVIIQLFWGAAEGGKYFAIYRLSRFLDVATMAIGVLLFPTISTLYAKSDMEKIKRLSYTAERYLSMIIFPIVLSMVFLSKPVIHILLSNEFYPAIPILQILPIFVLFDALERPYQMKLLGMNLPHFARNRILIMVIINVGLNILLIPRDIRLLGVDLFGMGAVGAAIATVIAYAVGLVYTRWVVWQVSKIKVNLRIILHFIAATLMGLIVYSLNEMIYPINRWYGLILYGILGLGIYFCILWLMQEFTRKDLELLMDTLNIKKMFCYIRDEIRFR